MNSFVQFTVNSQIIMSDVYLKKNEKLNFYFEKNEKFFPWQHIMPRRLRCIYVMVLRVIILVLNNVRVKSEGLSSSE